MCLQQTVDLIIFECFVSWVMEGDVTGQDKISEEISRITADFSAFQGE